MGDPAPIPRDGAIDAHVHIYPPEVAENPAAWGAARGEPAWTECVAPRVRRSIQGWADPETAIADMDEAGVAACVMLGWYWERQETCDLQNGWHAHWIRRHPGRLLGFATVQPSAGQRAIDALERALDTGLCGIGELLPPAQPSMLEDRWWRRVFETAEARAVPVTLHATDPEAGPAAGPATPLGDCVRVAREFPGVNIIMAHLGGGLAFRDQHGPLPPNLYFDTAASPLLYDSGVFRRAVDRAGADRVVYGSDYPLILYPREAPKAGFGRFLHEIAEAELLADEKAKIFRANIRRLVAAHLI